MKLEARYPIGSGWQRVRASIQRDANVVDRGVWCDGRATVISDLTMADLPDGSGVGPQWHVSVAGRTKGGAAKRPKPHVVRSALRAFRMTEAEEDNHHPGNARHFWLPMDPQHRVDCECKTDEAVIVDADGYAWTNPHEGAGECRGCELERLTGKRCPLHAKEMTTV